MRNLLARLGLAVMLAACGGSELSMSDYGDRLNEMVGAYAPEAEAAWTEFQELPDPTLEDLENLFDRDVATRIGVEEAFRELDPPREIADLHALLLDWLTRLADADAAALARIDTVGSREEFLRSAEYRTFE